MIDTTDPDVTASSTPRTGRTTKLVRSLEELNRFLGSTSDPLESLSGSMQQIAAALDCEVSSFYRYDPESESLTLAASHGLPVRSIGRVTMHKREGLVGLVVEQQAPVVIVDSLAHPRFKFFPETGEEKYHSFLGVPVGEGTEILGVLVVQSRRRRRFEPEVISLVNATAGLLAARMINARLTEQLQHREEERERHPREMEMGVTLPESLKERRELEGAPTSDEAPHQGARFSDAAVRALQIAKALAKQSTRNGITSSCLLFGLCESAGLRPDTASFLRTALDRQGRYRSAFTEFLGDSQPTERQREIDLGGWIGGVSLNTSAILASAGRIARETSSIRGQIHVRHLLGALLQDGASASASVRGRLERLGSEAHQLRVEFREFLASSVEGEDMSRWDCVLEASAGEDATSPSNSTAVRTLLAEYETGPAGFSAEACGLGTMREVSDDLGVDALAKRLADLIALRETKLPIAIGLFGNWGSGKSHFMNLMDRRLRELAETAEATTSVSPWCKKIVPIYFSAWHYLDSNLWASLISQIFESLFAYLRLKPDELEQVQKLLESASGVTARAAEEVAVAHAETGLATVELSNASKALATKETAVRGFATGLRALLPTGDLELLKTRAAELLDIRIETLDELQGAVETMRQAGGRLKVYWQALWNHEGRSFRLGWLAAMIGVPLATSYALSRFTSFGLLTQWLAATLTGAAVFVRRIRPFMVHTREGMHQLEHWATRAKVAYDHAMDSPEVCEKRAEVEAAQIREREARRRLADAQAREEQLRVEAAGLAPGRRMGRFIEQRAQSADYRGQLGLISLARRDFQELSDLFADTDKYKERATESHSVIPAGEIDRLSRAIDRIVLFIDDLDRCKADKVVEILQAVHLLLAFPLFAVVVGVDQRCLRQSLRTQFGSLIANDPEDVTKGDGAERRATPLDYLEKIFHVPFHLPAMEKAGFESLITRLTEPTRPEKEWAETGANGDSKEEPDPLDEKQRSRNTYSSTEADSETPATARHTHDSPGSPPPDRSLLDAIPRQVIGSVPLQDWERKALAEFHWLIQTPRGAKRLLNTYRLVRAGIPQEEWGAYCGSESEPGEYRLPMLLLASAAGYPAVAREWFAKLRALDDPSTLEEIASGQPPDWSRLREAYKATTKGRSCPLTPQLMAKWLDRVERYTF